MEPAAREASAESAPSAPSAQAAPSTPAPAPAHDGRVRSYVLRGGRLGPGQQRALVDLGPRFVLPWQATWPDWDAVFGRAAPRILEVGFGMGDATAAVAAALPDHDLIGVEVHEAGVGALLKLIGERGLANVRIVRHDAVEVLRTMVAPASLAGIHVWFPDPWPKKRHHKRRLLQPAFVAELARRLASGGYLHCATDWQPYAEQMLDVLAGEPLLVNRAAGCSARPPWRPLTRFEQRGLKLGHGVWDLVFERR
ncbi:MAG: tRNA (guanosine(46)-N7)-methyltransferase TrmB [Betaproteobacteria bacterium]|nr:tRNA (guanosine(46)-N7)-methyltransferase TrmB [Betaproteobacteria bacterium]